MTKGVGAVVERVDLAVDVTVYIGDCREAMQAIPAGTVQCVVTSDPYWGLRDYGLPPSDWPEVTYRPVPGMEPITVPAWRGCYGLEPTPEMYVGHSVLIRRELWRVMRDDAVQWLNLGDSYAGGGNGGGGSFAKDGIRRALPGTDKNKATHYGDRGIVNGLKSKDLVGIPWRVAFALQADGWYLRSDVIWSKPNPMPESVTDRPTRAHEYLFLLTKSQRYYYDADAVRENYTGHNQGSKGHGEWNKHAPGTAYGPSHKNTLKKNDGTGRNRRTVWTIATEPTIEAHFATFPQKLVEPCILAGTSPQACPSCGAPWARVVEREKVGQIRPMAGTDGRHPRREVSPGQMDASEKTTLNWVFEHRTTGWSPTCTCENNDGSGICTVLDPFGGSGTVGLAAARFGRRAVLCELNPGYVEIMRKRLSGSKAQRQFGLGP